MAAQASANTQPRALRGATRPSDLAVAAYQPYQDELVDALWSPNRSIAYYNITLPGGVHLECPTLGSAESSSSIHLDYHWSRKFKRVYGYIVGIQH